MIPLLTALATCMVLALYAAVSMNVGRARVRYGVEPPATSGNPDFERRFRVQQNTLEQMAFFLPSMWLFAWYVSDQWAATLGVLWVAARAVYAFGYYSAAGSRMPGFLAALGIGMLTFLGACAGVVSAFL